MINEWKSLEPNILDKKQKFTKILKMSNEVRAINSSLNLMHVVCKDKKFKSIDSLKFEIERLEVNY